MKKALVLLTNVIMLAAIVTGCSGNSSTAPASNSTVPVSSSAAPSSSTQSEAVTPEVQWPAGNTIYFDVPGKAGGGTDLITRYLTNGWTPLISANIVVTNYDTPEVGAQHAAKAKPDGMTLTMSTCTNMDNYLTGSSEVHPIDDLTVIAKINAGGAQAFFTRIDAPYSNMQELKEYALANPGGPIVGCTLGGTSQLMWLKVVKAMGGIELNYVQCSSEADKLANVAASSIDLGNGSLNNCIAYEADNRIKILGIMSYSEEAGKNDINPDLGDQYLTTWEQGFRDSSWLAGYYVVGPAGMDEALVEKINQSLQEAVKSDSYVNGMKDMAMVVDVRNVADSRAEYSKEWEIQVELTKDAGINVRG